MSHLLETFSLRGVTLRNRIGVSPMCQYSAEDGCATDWHLTHLGARAAGGAGLVIVEATAVEARGRITPQDLGLWKDEQIEPLARIVRFLHSQGAVAGIQLAHAGRKASTSRPWDGGGPLSAVQGAWQTVGASPIPFTEGFPIPTELDAAEIQQVIAAFQSAAQRALAAGFDWIELHGAHGYLIHSFYSPLSNLRTDPYGGSLQNRARLAIETTRAVRQVMPDRIPLTMRLSCTDWVEDGWNVEDSVSLAHLLKGAGIDLLDCSSGGNVPRAQVPVGAGYQVPFADKIRRDAHLPTAAVGMITQPMQADQIIRNGQADLVLLGREMLRDAAWAIHAAHALHKPEAACVPPQYQRAY